jgi:hypothetical protein
MRWITLKETKHFASVKMKRNTAEQWIYVGHANRGRVPPKEIRRPKGKPE